MATITYSTLADNSVTAFNPVSDVLSVDGGLDATQFDWGPIETGPNTGLGVVFRQQDINGNTVKTIYLLMSGSPDAFNPYKLTSGNITFVSGSLFLIGDNSTGTGDDASSVTLTGGSGNDFLLSLGGSQTLNGGDGNDILATVGGGGGTLGGSGTDAFIGGNGIDWLGLNDVAGLISYTVNLALGTGSVTGANPSSFTIATIENVGGSMMGDSITGDANANQIEGHEGNDTITGGLGNDTLNGGSDIDTVSYAGASGGVTVNLGTGTATGAAGSDVLSNFENIEGSAFNDSLLGNTGNNLITGLAGNDFINAGQGNDTIDGGTGNDIASYQGATGAVIVSLASGTASGADGNDVLLNIESIRGGASADTLTEGSAAANAVQFLATDIGETVEGMGGNDTLIGSAAANAISIVSYSQSTAQVTVNLGTGTASDGWGGTDTLSNFDGVSGGSAGRPAHRRQQQLEHHPRDAV